MFVFFLREHYTPETFLFSETDKSARLQFIVNLKIAPNYSMEYRIHCYFFLKYENVGTLNAKIIFGSIMSHQTF